MQDVSYFSSYKWPYCPGRVVEWGRKLVNATLLSVFKVRRLLANFTQLSEMKKTSVSKPFAGDKTKEKVQ